MPPLHLRKEEVLGGNERSLHSESQLLGPGRIAALGAREEVAAGGVGVQAARGGRRALEAVLCLGGRRTIGILGPGRDVVARRMR